ncbi:ThuA domain-containing protein [Tamlana fucoidanivorans]|uniref:ThuA domain-containing protein n=1 Tax=Allotamlana fucoidanivorans TaxID=2583814 RepID=A0A5C4SG40_9FLAO|nr:ThuA domain-containing protein [Tamlana fucoidanivorans]TNJ41704.1 ThuA domain-containing protein [Tamlana fucoidanivorans]
MLFRIILLVILTTTFFCCKSQTDSRLALNSPTLEKKIKVLIVDGENNHGIWPKTTFMMKDYLEQTGLFEVDINRKKYTWMGPHFNPVKNVSDIHELLKLYPLQDGVSRIEVDSTKYDPDFNPNFKNYDVVISNFGWKSSQWPEATKANFETFVKNGGGFVLIHAANNAWGDWDQFNKMIGLGGWGGRDIHTGPYVYYNDDDELVRDPSDGKCASHGPQHNYVLKTRAKDHPIMKGLPETWLHTKDELYAEMRGPAENMTILATAYSDKKYKGTQRHEPMLMTIDYGKGRIFHSAMGHMDYSFECVGFITTFQRGVEWAATGKVTQKVPEDFPTEQSVSIRKWNK